MAIKLLQGAKWYLWQGAARLGIAGIMGMSILAFCAMFELSTIQPLNQQLTDLQVVLSAKPSARLSVKPGNPLTQLHNQLTAFYKSFPERSDMGGQVENLFDTAKKYNLVLENGTYELTRGDTRKLARCDIQLPLKGSYVQTREFVANVLQSMPNAALSAIEIHRQKISDPTIDAQIKLTLFYRET